jgi:tRNA dimethylallyltransferase
MSRRDERPRRLEDFVPTARLAELEPPRGGELLVVVGPTASGKTELAIRLAERFDGEVLSADSVQIYRGFDLGSGKPTPAERARAIHHLVDAVDPLDQVDASRYRLLAEAALEGVRARGKVPIVCGGTYLWVKALIEGLAEAAPADEGVRARHRDIAERAGRARVHAMLAEVDPASAMRLAPNDLLRTSRALEVYELTGRPMSEWQAEHAASAPRHKAKLVGIAHPRGELDERITERTRCWLAEGWIDEVRRLVDAGYGGARAMGSVGYKQVHAHLAGELAASELELAIVRATRTYVRRQRTWLRDEPVTWLYPEH